MSSGESTAREVPEIQLGIGSLLFAYTPTGAGRFPPTWPAVNDVAIP